MTLLDSAKEQVAAIKAVALDAERLDLSETLVDGGKDAVARVYEVYVSLRALNDLAGHWDLRLVNISAGAKKLRFPHSPGDKVNYPYFEAYSPNSEECEFQVCFGTKIENGVGTKFSPDVSFQVSDSPLKPTGEHLVFCWDQKYTDSNRLNRDEVAKVASLISLIKPTAKLTNMPFIENWPNLSAVITNKNRSTLHQDDLKRLMICEVSECNERQSGFVLRGYP